MPRGRPRSFGRPRFWGPAHAGLPTLDTSGVTVDVTVLAAAGDVNAIGGWYVTQFDDAEVAETVGFWAATEDVTTVLDATPQFFGSVAIEPLELDAAQDYSDDYPHDDDLEDPWWHATYGFPDQDLDVAALLAPPPAEPIETFAAQPGPEPDWATFIPTDTEDYQAESSLDDAAVFFPPAVVEPIETFAAQPHGGELPLEETLTEDYQSSAELDTPTEWFPPPADPEAQAEAQLPEHDAATLVPEETTDYAADSTLDVAPFLGAEPVETFVAQPFPDNDWLPGTETEDYVADSALDVGPFLTSSTPEAELLAAQPHGGEIELLPDELTVEDWHATTTETPESLVLPPPTDAEVVAAQPELSGDDYWGPETVDEPTVDPLSTHDVSALVPPPAANTPEEFQAAAQLAEHDAATLIAEETSDYQTFAELDVPALYPPPPSDVEAQAASQTLGDDFEVFWPADADEPYWHPATPLDDPTEWPPPPTDAELLAAQSFPELPSYAPEETEDYAADSSLDVAALTPATAAEPIETFAAQPYGGELPELPEETADYDAESALGIGPFLTSSVPEAELVAATTLPDSPFDAEPVPEDAVDSALDVAPMFAGAGVEIFAAQPTFGEWDFWVDEPVDDGDDQTLDVATFLALPATVDVFAAQPHGGELPIPPEETEDYANDSVDVAWYFAAAPPPMPPSVISFDALKDPGIQDDALKDPGIAEPATAGQQVAADALKDPGESATALRDPGVQKP